jgi:glycosyltransferase involved in cell wall biosynthesis
VDRALYRPGPAREPGLIVSTRMHEGIYDLPIVIEALVRLMARRPETQAVFAGAGSQTGALYARASARLPRGRWRFSGRLEPAAMATLLARAEISVSASRSDSTSLSLLESMSCGAIPVVTDIEGNREWVGEGDGARLFAPGDAAGLAAALERALTDPLWASAARERNQRIVAARGDWAVNLTRIEALYASLAAAHERGGA